MSVEVYPVVHVSSTDQAVEQSGIAFENGADGVFVIDHSGLELDEFTAVFAAVKQAFPKRYVGINYLGLGSAYNTLNYLNEAHFDNLAPQMPDGIWVDDAVQGWREGQALRRHKRGLRKIQYLGGTAFKYTDAYTDDPDFAAFQAAAMAKYVDVVTTSGPGTGHPPSPDKIKAMKQVIGRKPLAIASGVSAENLHLYRPYVDKLLVASSLETLKYSGKFVPAKIRQLVDEAKGW